MTQTANATAGSYPRPRASSRGRLLCGLMALFVAVLFLSSLSLGKIHTAPRNVCSVLAGHGHGDDTTMLVRQVRLPRVTAAVFVGAALAGAGLLMQTVLRNPLATPSVLGLGNGAQLGLVLALVFAPGAAEFWPTLAACGGALVVAVVIGSLAMGRTARMDRDFVVVGGTLIGALLGSSVTGLMLINHMNGALSDWQVGELVKVTWARVAVAIPSIAAGLLLAGMMVRRIDVLSLGRSVAEGLGVRTRAYLLGAMGAVVLLAGASVAIAGPLAYVGLIVPHIFSRRRMPDAMLRLLACLLGGALLAAVADLLTRSVDVGRIIPMGVWTMSLGALFFFAMTLRSRVAQGSD